MSEKSRTGWAFFACSLLVYAFTRLYALDQFPIYFFTDEAVHPVYGIELAQNGWRDAARNLLPTYFQNGQYWNLSLSVYLHALTASLFGETIFVTRATSAALSIVGVAAVALMLKWIFNLRLWWSVVLFLAAAPAWFLHSRTAFETVLMVSFYAGFLLCYLLYRYRSPRFIFPALIFGAATFYAYSNGQAVMAVSGILLLLSDLRYHLKHWRLGFGLVAFGFLLFLPYARFRLLYPDAATSQLYLLNSYWLQPIPLADKLARFAATYTYGLSPQYWFDPNVQELARHLMKGYGNLAWWMFPFILIGLAICLRQWRSSAHRAILIAALAAPFGSALADIGITRVLMFVIPAMVCAAIGLDALIARFWRAVETAPLHGEIGLRRLGADQGAVETAPLHGEIGLRRLGANRRRSVFAVMWSDFNRRRWATTLAVFGLLALVSCATLRDALINGPTWHTNYGLYGMQWGAKQIFVDTLPRLLDENPGMKVYVSHTWANGANLFPRFFGMDRAWVQMESVLGFLDRQMLLEENAFFVMTREEFAVAQASPKFKPIGVEEIIPFPDGRPGFFIARVAYSENAGALFAAERAAQREPITELFQLNSETVQVTHTKFDIGGLRQIFDGDIYSVARGVEANPLMLEIAFPQPRALSGLTGIFGRVRFRLTARLYAPDAAEPIVYEGVFDFHEPVPGQFSGPPATLAFERGPALVSKLRLDALYLDGGDSAHVHVFELNIK